jgi:hypothetical protein
MGRRKGRCPTCGCYGPLDHEHVARRANDKDFTLDICLPDHKFKTRRDDSAGNIPGIDPSGARLIGTLQHLIIMSQRNGADSVAQLYRKQSRHMGALHGQEGVSWGRHNGVAEPIAEADILVIIRDTARITAALWKRLLTDPRMLAAPAKIQVTLMTIVEYYEQMTEYPLYWIRHAEAADLTAYIAALTVPAQFIHPKGFREQYYTEQAWNQWETPFMMEAASFLRYLRETRENAHDQAEAPGKAIAA